MSNTYTLELTNAQKKALETEIIDIQEWIENFVFHRAQVTIDSIVNVEVQRKLDAGETISGTKEDIVLGAPIESAAERQQRIDSQPKI